MSRGRNDQNGASGGACRRCGRKTESGEGFCTRCIQIAKFESRAVPELQVSDRLEELTEEQAFWILMIVCLAVFNALFFVVVGWLAIIPIVLTLAYVAVHSDLPNLGLS